MKHKYLKSVVTLKLNQEKCTGCGMCITVCPHEVFTIKEWKAQIINRDSCMECGACAKNCLFSAIQVKTGVGCAAHVISVKLNGNESNCGCSVSDDGCC
jgi:ferredoxin